MYRKSKVLRYLFICLFLTLFSIGQSHAQTNPELAKARATLTNQPWTIYLIYQQMRNGNVESVVEQDVLTFTKNTVLLDHLSRQGYLKDGSSYKLKINADGVYIWQSVQLHANQKDSTLIKGELKNEVMTGVIVYQPQGKPAVTANFTTVPPEL